LTDMSANEVVVHDELQSCPYLDDRVACMPLRLQLAPLVGEAFDRSLDAGDRRVGRMVYRTACPECSACEPLRIDVNDLEISRSQRRVARRNRDVRVEVGPATVDPVRLDLFNRHRLERDLATSGRAMASDEYAGWFVQSCCRTVEMRYLVDDRLIGLGIVDVGERDTSSVYFYFDPEESDRSLGTLSVLTEVGWLRARGGRYHYLGLYVADCDHLNYKARFHPHERRGPEGEWRRIEKAAGPTKS